MDEDGATELVNFSRPIEVRPATGKHQKHIIQILRLRDLIFPKPGTYQFSILVDSDEKATLPIELELRSYLRHETDFSCRTLVHKINDILIIEYK